VAYDMTTVVQMSSVTASVLGGFDQWVAEQFLQHSVLTDVARRITDAGVLGVLLPIAAFCGVLLWWRYRSIAIAVAPWVAVQLNSSLVAVLKRTFDVARPPREFWLAGASGGSFPSGHTANTTCLLVAVAALIFLLEQKRESKRAAIIVASAGSVLMGWTRLALHVHWFSDVLAGWCLGVCVAAIVAFAAVLVKSRREIPLQTRDQSAD
jgi:undecaprenyl-diphosphatase